ncbi:MAG: phospholipase A [Proteobacteria bacterium]|nr:phospholipase A [Pseudomonadota bacterium]MBU2228366.1 phospholipase A [Pseudomonadota bacterium]MBU2261558.1 phospholipase A [Pseudomonadota bacterium]
MSRQFERCRPFRHRNDSSLILKTWARIPERDSKDDNPDIISYLGYGEIWAGTVWRDYHLGAHVQE